MLITEPYVTRLDGVVLIRTYSDEGYFIEREDILYEEAIDPKDSGRVYHETDILIPVEDEEPDEGYEEDPEIDRDVEENFL